MMLGISLATKIDNGTDENVEIKQECQTIYRQYWTILLSEVKKLVGMFICVLLAIILVRTYSWCRLWDPWDISYY